MLGAGPGHALAPELTLRPVLTEIGGTTVRGLYVARQPPTTTRRRTPTGSPPPGRSSPPLAARRSRRHERRPPLTTNQDLDPARLREAFGVFPSGVVAVAAEVDGRLDRAGRELVHLGEPRPAAGVVLGRQHVQDLARPAPGRPPRPDRAGRPPRRGLPAAGRAGRAPLRRRRRSPRPTTARSPSTRGWPASTARSTARSRPATTRSCCCGCTPSRQRRRRRHLDAAGLPPQRLRTTVRNRVRPA